VDDGARVTTKQPLLFGTGVATFANISSYSRGINGLMLDVDGLPGAVSVADFGIKVGNTDDTSTWATGPAPNSVSVRPGAGVNGATRVTLTWADNTIVKTWLQVKILANTNTELATPLELHFGHWTGDTGVGNSAIGNQVDLTDLLQVRSNFTTSSTSAGMASVHDFNRDGAVDLSDILAVRNNFTTSTSFLRFITPTVGGGGGGGGEGEGSLDVMQWFAMPSSRSSLPVDLETAEQLPKGEGMVHVPDYRSASDSVSGSVNESSALLESARRNDSKLTQPSEDAIYAEFGEYNWDLDQFFAEFDENELWACSKQ